MKKTRALLFSCLCLVVAAGSPVLAEMDYEVNFVVGQKALDADDWAPLEDQTEFGVTSSFGKPEWPLWIALDLLGSADDMLGFDASTGEFDVGVRKIWGDEGPRPFLGGGLAFVNGEIEAFGVSVDDDAIGGWVDGGVFWRLGRRFNLGIEARLSRAEITIGGIDVEAGGEHLGVILGFGKARD